LKRANGIPMSGWRSELMLQSAISASHVYQEFDIPKENLLWASHTAMLAPRLR
jgi:hypothetical protein